MPRKNNWFRIYAKKMIRLDNMKVTQMTMFQIGNVALASRKLDVSRALNTHGGPAKPLSKRYAIRKSKWTGASGKGRNKRDLSLSGDMMRELTVRTVSNKVSIARWTTRRNRMKARANNAIEEFVAYSEKNRNDTLRAARIIVQKLMPGMIKEVHLT